MLRAQAALLACDITLLAPAAARCHNHKFDPIPHRAETSRLDGLLKPLRQSKKDVEAPYLKQLVDREIALLPEYLCTALATPPAQRAVSSGSLRGGGGVCALY